MSSWVWSTVPNRTPSTQKGHCKRERTVLFGRRTAHRMLIESLERWSCFCLVLFSIYSNCFCQSLATWNTIREGGLQQKLKQLTKNNAMIILDGDNIRGKTRFKLSKEGQNVEIKLTVSLASPTVHSSNDFTTVTCIRLYLIMSSHNTLELNAAYCASSIS